MVFASYSHRDKDLTARLVRHLSVLKRNSLSCGWTRALARAATGIRKFKSAIEAATVAIFLVSADFLTSDFVAREEVPRLLRRSAEFGSPYFQSSQSPAPGKT